MYIYIYVYMYICIHVYIYIYIYVYTVIIMRYKWTTRQKTKFRDFKDTVFIFMRITLICFDTCFWFQKICVFLRIGVP